MPSTKTLRKMVCAFGVAIMSVLSIVPIQATASGPVVFDVHLIRHGLYKHCDA